MIWRGLLLLPVIVAALLVAISPFHWLADLAANFRHCIAAAALGALALIWRGGGHWRWVGLVLVGYLAWPLLGYVQFPRTSQAVSTQAVSTQASQAVAWRVLSINLAQQRDHAVLFARLAADPPDLLLFTELPDGDVILPPALAAALPHHSLHTSQGHSIYDVQLLSRWPLLELSGIEGVAAQQVLSTRICRGSGDCFTLIGMHAQMPLAPPGLAGARRDRQLLAVAALAAGIPDGRVLLIGDLNATPWSPGFQAMLKAGSLRDTAPMLGLAGLAPTWPSWLPAWLGLNIDHALIGSGLTLRQRRLIDDPASDHRALWVEVAP